MGRVAVVLTIERTEGDEEAVLDVKIDPGGGANLMAPHFGAAGDDSPPLPGDYAVTVSVPGGNGEVVAGYLDPDNAGVAEGGERRLYSRDAERAIKATVWLRADGSVRVENDSGYWELGKDGTVDVNDNLEVLP